MSTKKLWRGIILLSDKNRKTPIRKTSVVTSLLKDFGLKDLILRSRLLTYNILESGQ